MNRVLEPEIMGDDAQAAAYARADFSAVNQGFVDGLLAMHPSLRAGGFVVDLGCGPADIPIRLVRAAPAVEVVAVDASPAMVHLGRQAVLEGGIRGVHLVCARLPELPAARAFDAVISNSLLHHLPDADPFWHSVRELLRRGGIVHVMDLARPPSAERARAIVETYSANEAPILKTDFFNSLLAAFTVEEIREQLDEAGFDGLTCRLVSDRHWLVSGRC